MSHQGMEEDGIDHQEARAPEGRFVSRYNAQKHAILRETLTEYEIVDAEELYNDLSEDLKPLGRVQELLVEMIASNGIRLCRIAKAEAEQMKEALHPNFDLVRLKLEESAYFATIPSSKAEQLLLYSRYQTASENRIYRALVAIRQLKLYEQG